MVKPQFEVGRSKVGKGGVVRDLDLRASAVAAVAELAATKGWGAQSVTTSALPGPSGNVEFFLWLRQAEPRVFDAEIATEVRRTSAWGAPGEKVDS